MVRTIKTYKNVKLQACRSHKKGCFLKLKDKPTRYHELCDGQVVRLYYDKNKELIYIEFRGGIPEP
jgi:hypothetical protein